MFVSVMPSAINGLQFGKDRIIAYALTYLSGCFSSLFARVRSAERIRIDIDLIDDALDALGIPGNLIRLILFRLMWEPYPIA